jgi:NADH dehydrogenase
VARDYNATLLDPAKQTGRPLARARRAVCLLGGTGFVGHHLAARLAHDGHELTVVTRYREAHRDLLVLPALTLVQADVTDPLTLRQLFAGCSAVINLVGIVNERGRDGSGFARLHTRLAGDVVAACRDAGVRRLLHMSALNADPAGPSHYLRSKGLAEQAVRDGAGAAVSWTLFRPSLMFGPGDFLFNRFAGLLRLLPVLPLARPEARFAPVYVGDVVEAFARCLDDPSTAGRSYELCGPRTWSLRAMAEAAADQLRLRRRIVGLPDPLARLQARIMDFVPGKPFSTDNYRTLAVDGVCVGKAPGLDALGIAPRSVEGVIGSYLAPADGSEPTEASSSPSFASRSGNGSSASASVRR